MVWGVLALGYGIISFFLFGFTLYEVVVDAVVLCSSFALVGLVVWNVVKYTGIDLDNVINALVTHISAAAVLLIGWSAFAQSILAFLLPEQKQYYRLWTTNHFYRLAIAAVLYLFLILNYYLLIYYDGYRQRKEHEQKLNEHLNSARLNMLKAQINPHFIFNSLNSISSLTLTNPEKAHEMVINLSEFLRYTVGKYEEQFVSLKNEIQAIRHYLEIEQVRYGDRLTLDIACDIQDEGWEVPALIVQPLLENAIKHGLHERADQTMISVTCMSKSGNTLDISVSNEYDEDGVVPKGEGIGLVNVTNRLQLLYHRSDLLSINKSDGTFIATLTIPKR